MIGRWVLAGILAVFTGGTAALPFGTTAEELRIELVGLNAGFSRALEKKDAGRVAGFFTEDARIIESTQQTIRGREAIATYFDSWFDAGFLGMDIVIDEVYGDEKTVVEVGRSFPHFDSGGAAPSSRYMAIWKRVDGRLRMHRVMSNR